MTPARTLVLFALLGACDRGDAPSGSPRLDFDTLPTLSVTPDEQRALADVGLAALGACRAGPVGATTVAAVMAGPFPFDAAALHAACAEVAQVFDDHRGMVGQARSTDRILGVLATVADEVDALGVLMDSERPELRRSALEHVHNALATAEEALVESRDAPLRGYAERTWTPDTWQRWVGNDDSGVSTLRRDLQNYAFVQHDPQLVRDRLLRLGFDRAVPLVATRKDAAAEADTPTERAARQAYVAAMRRTFETLHDVAQRWLDDAVPASGRAALIARADAAHEAWVAAWTTEMARVGLEVPEGAVYRPPPPAPPADAPTAEAEAAEAAPGR